MKKSKILVSLLSLTIAAGLSLTGCGNKASTPTVALDANQHLNLALPVNNIKTLDISKATDAYSGWIQQETFESLGRLNVDSKGNDVVEKAGASNWTTSSDGLTWTFTIRDNKWSDGKAVTAGDYAYSLLRTLDSKTASEYAYLLVGSGIKDAGAYNSGKGQASDVGIVAKDDHTLVITLDKPSAYFEKLLPTRLFAPERKDLVDKYGDKYGVTSDTLVFNGPFKITSFQNGNSIELAKNDQYWDKDSVKLTGVTFKFIKDNEALLNSLYSGQIDSAGVTSGDWSKKLTATNKFDHITGVNPADSYDFYNTKDKLFSNVHVREAFILALDREDYVKTLWDGLAFPAYGWVPKGLLIGDKQYRDQVPEQLKGIKDDPKQLLIQGLKELNLDPDPTKLTVNYLSGGTDQRSKDFADWAINQYKTKLGVTVKANFEDWAQYQTDISKGNYQFSGMGWGADYNDPMTMFDMWETGADIVPNGWSNKDYDALIEDAKSTTDNNKRLDDFAKAEKILLTQDFVISPLIYRQINTFRAKYVKGAVIPLFGSGTEIKKAYISGKGK